MASQEESKLLSHQQAANNKTHHQQKESSVKMNEKPISEPQEKGGKSSKNGAKDSAPKDSTVRVCDFCGKEFNSGKALGGHRRYHIQALKKMEAQKNLQPPPTPSNQYTLRIKPNNNVNININIPPQDLVINNNIIIGNGNGNGNVNNNSPSPSSSSRSFRCRVCDKYFPSEKSLYGHMRSHPEREWRGMNPPFTPSSSDEEEMKDEDNHNGFCSYSAEGGLLCSSSSLFVDLSLSCAGSSWLKKDKRGRKSIGAAEGAENLMFLSHLGDSLHRRRRLPPTTPPQEVVQQLPVKKRKKNSSGSSSSPPDWKEKLLEGSHDDDDDGNGSLEGEKNVWQMTVISLMKKENVIKMNKKNNKKEKVLEKMVKSKGEDQLVIKTLKQEVVVKSSPTPPQKYVCDICGKSFNCFQALGGHKSKHNKENHKKGKEVVVGKKPEEEVEVCNNNGDLLMGGEEEKGASSVICSEERLVISSNGNEEINMSNEEEEVGEAIDQSDGSKMMDIDLNVTYVMENED